MAVLAAATIRHNSLLQPTLRFAVAGRSGQFDLVWDERKRLLTWIGVANNPARPTTTHECVVTKPRSIMESYPNLVRWR
jgi:hypothetical protein